MQVNTGSITLILSEVQLRMLSYAVRESAIDLERFGDSSSLADLLQACCMLAWISANEPPKVMDQAREFYDTTPELCQD